MPAPLDRLSRDRAAQLRARRDRALARREAQARARRRGLLSLSGLALATIVILAWALSGSGAKGQSAAGGATTAASSRSQLPKLVASLSTASQSGTSPRLPWPAKGQGAVAVMGSGLLAESTKEHPVPIASLTKMMTAYLVLKAHPLSGDEQGPSLHFTAATHRAWIRYSENDLSNVELVAGESLTERQLLEALLIPSADNVADILARWVGGTEARFVSEMNSTAASFGMTKTHYTDASGVDAHTVSTAADQAVLASILMRNAVVRSIVKLPDVAFPVAGHVWNYNPAIGTDGIVGVKSGFTQAAGGCLVTAAWRKVGGRSVLVISASTGQILGLGQAASEDEALLTAAAPKLKLLSPGGSDLEIGRLSLPWAPKDHVGVYLSAPVVVAGLPGSKVTEKLVGATVTSKELKSGWPAGAVVGTLEVRSRLSTVETLPVHIERSVPPPPSGSVPARPPVQLSVAS